MDKQELLNTIAAFSDFEAKYYLSIWKATRAADRSTSNSSKIAPNKLFTNKNVGDMSRLALLTIVVESAQGEAWMLKTMEEQPYQGEPKNFSQQNARDVNDVMAVLAAVLSAPDTEIKFAMSGGKIDFSLSFNAMSNPLIQEYVQKIAASTNWLNPKTANPTVVILTPIEVERQAVLTQLPEWRTYLSPTTQTRLSEATFQGNYHEFKIYNQLSGSGLIETALAIESLAQELKPDLVLMVGVAGGVKDVKKGDLVIGEKAYGYERGKETDEGFMARPQVFNYSHRLIQLSRWIVDAQSWQSRVIPTTDFPITAEPRIVFGPIASGNKVIASNESALVGFLKTHFNDTLAVEMEAIGFQALLRHEKVKSLNIRGISDLLGDKVQADQQNHQPLAAARAAAFAFELLQHLDLSQHQ